MKVNALMHFKRIIFGSKQDKLVWTASVLLVKTNKNRAFSNALGMHNESLWDFRLSEGFKSRNVFYSFVNDVS